MNRVVITGMGWITPMGHTLDSVWKRLLAGESGIALTSIFDASTFPTRISAEVKNYDPTEFLGDLGPHAGAGRNTLFALALWPRRGRRRSWIAISSISIALESISAAAKALSISTPTPRPRFFLGRRRHVDGHEQMGASRLRADERRPANWSRSRTCRCRTWPCCTGARGPAMNCLTACAASTQAIGEATEILRRGDADVMIGGGAHSMIHPFGVTGFNRLTALSTLNEDPRAPAVPSMPSAAVSSSAKERGW